MIHLNRTSASLFRHLHRDLVASLVALVVGMTCLIARGDPVSDERINPAGIPGSLVICGGGSLPDEVLAKFVELAGGKSAHLVVIPTASEDEKIGDSEKLAEPWKKLGPASIEVLHTRSRDEANREEFVAPLKTATGVWFGGGQQSRIADVYVGTAVEQELMSLLSRDGVIGGTSAGAAVQSKLMIAGGNPVARTATGFDLLPQSVVDQHFLQRNRKPRLLRVLDENPGLVGFGVDESTALVVRHRHLEVLGTNKVTICLRASDWRPAKEIELQSGKVADFTALRRAARDRMRPRFPPVETIDVNVPHGTLFIVGGGRLPLEIMKRFVNYAGGAEGSIVVLPTAVEDNAPDGAGERKLLEAAGAKNIVVLSGRSIEQVESPMALDALKKATGIWFGGGRQWRFVDAYEGTKALELFHDVLRRGGAIGGSSAGASIQAEYMVRGSPLGNLEMMAEGYERGFGFLPGAAVDQHFTQRNRHPDMDGLMQVHPHLLGIGIDESTALIVQKDVAEVCGKNDAYFFDYSQAAPNVIRVESGKSFNLRTRKPVQ